MANLLNRKLKILQKKELDQLTDEEKTLRFSREVVRRGVGPAVESEKRKEECQMNKRCLGFGGSWRKGDDEDEGPTYPREVHYP